MTKSTGARSVMSLRNFRNSLPFLDGPIWPIMNFTPESWDGQQMALPEDDRWEDWEESVGHKTRTFARVTSLL
jgi:hypothetical protein